jgi:hypothetical protein
VPCLDVGHLEFLHQLGADVRDDLVFKQLAIALGDLGRHAGLRSGIVRRFPLLHVVPDMLGHRDFGRLDVGAVADGGDQLA